MPSLEAVANHVTWVGDLWRQVHDGRSVDPDAVRHWDICPLGEWLTLEAPRLGHLDAFWRFEASHRRFHESLHKAAAAAHSGHTGIALTALDVDGLCSVAARELLGRWVDLQRALAEAPAPAKSALPFTPALSPMEAGA